MLNNSIYTYVFSFKYVRMKHIVIEQCVFGVFANNTNDNRREPSVVWLSFRILIVLLAMSSLRYVVFQNSSICYLYLIIIYLGFCDMPVYFDCTLYTYLNYMSLH